jgi:hypothetical protein
MHSKASLTLFITSFFPVAVFKVVARIGEASLAQAKLAVTVGLLLAGTQVILSTKWLGHSTYLEKAFLGFLAAGTVWVFLTPSSLSSLFVDHSTTLLYLTLFSITLLPQLFGYDPFTYAIAKQWTPEAVWKTPQFRTINLHITYFWSALFFLASLSCWLGYGKPLYSILLPLVLVLAVGLPSPRFIRDIISRKSSLLHHSAPPSLPKRSGNLYPECPGRLIRGEGKTFPATSSLTYPEKEEERWYFPSPMACVLSGMGRRLLRV